jgi:hypothetical protein
MKIRAIISDFDGTLCPTSSINPYDTDSNSLIPLHLEDILCEISKSIPICIISSKDFYFLYEKVRKFSNILSCILGMETLFLDNKDKVSHNGDTADSLGNNGKIDKSHTYIIDNKYSITSKHLLVDYEVLLNNSAILNEIVNYFEIKYPLITIEKKFLSGSKSLLGGITVDWRNDTNWDTNRKKYEEIIKKSSFNIYKT